MHRLGVRGHEAVAFEDSFNGLTAANAAGLYCVVVPNSMTGSMNFDQADLCLESLSDISLDGLLELLQT